MVRTKKWVFFFGPKNSDFGPKIRFSYGNLFFCTESRIAQVVTQILRPTDLVYDFLFPSYARFREGTRPMPQKVLPHPTVRAPSASNSPSALSAPARQKRSATYRTEFAQHCLLRLLSPEACWKKAKSRRKVNGLENGYSYQKEEILERQETICLCVLSYNFQMVFVRKGKAYNMQKHSRVINVLHKFYYYICEILKLSVQDAHIVRCT